MQNTRGEWKSSVKRLLSRSNLVSYDLAQDIVRKLGYPTFYNSKTTILDAYSGAGVFSAALHNEIKPQTHILMEPYPSYQKFLSTLVDPPRVYLEKEDPYRWTTFQRLIEEKKFVPTTQARSNVHNELLFTANLLHRQGEQLVAQYLNCITNQSWILRYGRIRLLLWMRAQTAEKILAPPNTGVRHRVSCQRESCCDARVVLHTPTKRASSKSSTSFIEPLIPDFDSKSNFVGGKVPDLSLVELTPHEVQIEHVDEFEYVIKMLMILKSKPLSQSLNSLGPGAVDDLSPLLEDIIHLKPYQLSIEQLKRITDVFWRWPFKPDILMDFYDDRGINSGSEDDTHS